MSTLEFIIIALILVIIALIAVLARVLWRWTPQTTSADESPDKT